MSLVPVTGKLLDIGCGNGMPIAAYFSQRGFDVMGIDSSQSMIDACQKKFPHQQWRVIDMRTLALNEMFDGLIAWDSFFIYRVMTNARCLKFSQHMPRVKRH